MSTAAHTIYLGRLGEDLAVRHYGRLGYLVLERNYRVRAGELDLVVQDASATVFVEVKTRTRGGMDPHEAITAAKRRRLRVLAASWLLENPGRAGARELRIDVVAVVVTRAGRLVSLEQYEVLR